MGLYRFFRAVSDLLWTFFPVFVVVLVLALLGKISHIAERSDLILCSAVLFAEGWWRVRKAFSLDRTILELVGFLGAMITVLLATVMLLVEAGKITQLSAVVASERFVISQYSALVLSGLYGLAVRMRVLEAEDLRRGREK